MLTGQVDHVRNRPQVGIRLSALAKIVNSIYVHKDPYLVININGGLDLVDDKAGLGCLGSISFESESLDLLVKQFPDRTKEPPRPPQPDWWNRLGQWLGFTKKENKC